MGRGPCDPWATQYGHPFQASSPPTPRGQGGVIRTSLRSARSCLTPPDARLNPRWRRVLLVVRFRVLCLPVWVRSSPASAAAASHVCPLPPHAVIVPRVLTRFCTSPLRSGCACVSGDRGWRWGGGGAHSSNGEWAVVVGRSRIHSSGREKTRPAWRLSAYRAAATHDVVAFHVAPCILPSRTWAEG